MMLNEHVGLFTATLNHMKVRTARNEFKTSAEFSGMCFFTKGKSKLRYARFDFCDGSSYDSKYAIGEIVALKESYEDIWHSIETFRGKAEYKEKYGNLAGWTNKMFVKNDLMPHQAKITDIKLERLQDISDEDCIREGIWTPGHGIYYFPSAEKSMSSFDSPRKAFAALVDYACGKGTWDRNEYNVVYYYKLVK